MYGEDAEGAYSVADSAKVANPGQYLRLRLAAGVRGRLGRGGRDERDVNVRSARATLADHGPDAAADREHGELHLHRHHRDRP